MDNIQCAAQFAAEVEHPFEGRAEASIGKPESTEGRPWGQPLKKLEGAPVNLG